MPEFIKDENSLLAIIIRADYKANGIEFFTPDDFSQQLGYMNRPKGYTIEPHKHVPNNRTITHTQEVLLIRSGKVKVCFYKDNNDCFTETVLNSGDVILLAAGGHGFEMLEQSEIIEIKQGPYSENTDKIRFLPTEEPSKNL